MKCGGLVISFMDHALVLYLRSHWHTQGHPGYLLCYLLRVLWFCFTFSSVIHFELIYVKGMRSVFRFSLSLFCMCMCHCSSTISWKDHLCAIVRLCQTLCGSISGLLYFSSYRSYTYFVRFIPQYFFFFFFFLSSGQMFLISNSTCLQLTFVY